MRATLSWPQEALTAAATMLTDSAALAIQRRMKRIMFVLWSESKDSGLHGPPYDIADRDLLWNEAELKKRSATACWVWMMSSVTGPITNDARLAATTWTSSGTPVTAASAAATSARCPSAQRAASIRPSMIPRVSGPWRLAKSRLAR
jgi:hypothetical protein